jgi:citrate lyase subunit beta/citryl-CoA lyase
MWSIHPSQIEPILEEMSTDFGELELACEVLLGAIKNDLAPLSLGGQLHDRASFRYFYHRVAVALASGASLPNGELEAILLATHSRP